MNFDLTMEDFTIIQNVFIIISTLRNGDSFNNMTLRESTNSEISYLISWFQVHVSSSDESDYEDESEGLWKNRRK